MYYLMSLSVRLLCVWKYFVLFSVIVSKIGVMEVLYVI